MLKFTKICQKICCAHIFFPEKLINYGATDGQIFTKFFLVVNYYPIGLGKASKKKYDKLGLLAEAWGGRGQVGAGGPNLLSVFLFIGVILSRGLET